MCLWIIAGSLLATFVFHPLLMVVNHIMNEPNLLHGHSLTDIIYLETTLLFSSSMIVWSVAFAFLGGIIGLYSYKLKASNTDLRASEKKNRDILNNIPGMVYRANPDWSTDVISNSKNICGYSPDEFNNKEKNWSNIIHPDDKQKVFKDSEKILQKTQSICQEYRIISEDGTTRWVSDHKTSIFDEHDCFIGVDGIVYDISKRKQLEEKNDLYRENLENLVKERTEKIEKAYQLIEKNEKKYRYLVETMWEGLVEVDSDWIITFINHRFQKMLGYSYDEIIGKQFLEFIDKEDLNEAETQLSLRHKGISKTYEVQLKCSDGNKIFVLCSPNPLYDSNGKYLGGLGVVADITEIKLREKERDLLVERLQEALENIKTLSGLIPICSSCKKIRDDKGYWNVLESYIQKNSEAQFSHSICPECSDELYGNEDWYIQMKKDKNEK